MLKAFIRTANACYKDAADLHADLEEYPQAIARYEQVANGSLSSALTKYSVKEYWLRSSLCALAMQVYYVNRKIFNPTPAYSSSAGPRYCETKPTEVFLA